jgi:hypothetical protein
MAVTKAQEVYDEVEKRIAAGTDKADAFKQLAEETGRPYDSVRGSYYSHKKKLEGGESKPRTRRRETTPDDALADARAALRPRRRHQRRRARRLGPRHPPPRRYFPRMRE